MIREPAVAGQFYPSNKQVLLNELKGMIPKEIKKVKAVGVVVPHAGHVSSGPVAGETYPRPMPRKTYIILSPNHTGLGSKFAVCGFPWRTPLGLIDVDSELVKGIIGRTKLVKDDIMAHVAEHSIEVQLPFIQYVSPGSNIVPITLFHGELKELKEIAAAIVSAVKDLNRDAMIIASSDMTHYEPRNEAAKKDKMAIQAVLDLDAEGLYNVVRDKDISMCGYIPTVIMLMCAKELNAGKRELVKYSDSGYASGDANSVVGYAGILIHAS